MKLQGLHGNAGSTVMSTQAHGHTRPPYLRYHGLVTEAYWMSMSLGLLRNSPLLASEQQQNWYITTSTDWLQDHHNMSHGVPLCVQNGGMTGLVLMSPPTQTCGWGEYISGNNTLTAMSVFGLSTMVRSHFLNRLYSYTTRNSGNGHSHDFLRVSDRDMSTLLPAGVYAYYQVSMMPLDAPLMHHPTSPPLPLFFCLVFSSRHSHTLFPLQSLYSGEATSCSHHAAVL